MNKLLKWLQVLIYRKVHMGTKNRDSSKQEWGNLVEHSQNQIGAIRDYLGKKYCESASGIEPETYCVLSSRHDQLDQADALLLCMLAFLNCILIES